ncbi:MAG: methyltransferase domain-containing protein [Planctomycetes bacterium]|nr:methyltransferase domain-containing protein [Planctomycetota bacterium]
MTAVFVLTTRGLEDVAAAELGRLAVVGSVGYRRVTATVAGDLSALLSLRTVDDLFIDCATWAGIARPRAVLATVRQLAGRLDLRATVTALRAVRALPPSPSFTVTASFVGKRNYSGEEIRAAVSSGIAERSGWNHVETDDEADLNVRVFIEHEIAYVGVRVAADPLHERTYLGTHRPGSLRPSIAASMLELAEVRPGMRVLDPCCGVGTIAIEAALAGARATAGDLDGDAISAARTHARSAGASVSSARWDARILPLAAASMERVVCNLPWDRQVGVDGALPDFHRRVGPAIARCVAPGGRLAVLTIDIDSLVFPGFTRVSTREISVSGQRPVIAVYA